MLLDIADQGRRHTRAARDLFVAHAQRLDDLGIFWIDAHLIELQSIGQDRDTTDIDVLRLRIERCAQFGHLRAVQRLVGRQDAARTPLVLEERHLALRQRDKDARCESSSGERSFTNQRMTRRGPSQVHHIACRDHHRCFAWRQQIAGLAHEIEDFLRLVVDHWHPCLPRHNVEFRDLGARVAYAPNEHFTMEHPFVANASEDLRSCLIGVRKHHRSDWRGVDPIADLLAFGWRYRHLVVMWIQLGERTPVQVPDRFDHWNRTQRERAELQIGLPSIAQRVEWIETTQFPVSKEGSTRDAFRATLCRRHHHPCTRRGRFGACDRSLYSRLPSPHRQACAHFTSSLTWSVRKRASLSLASEELLSQFGCRG